MTADSAAPDRDSDRALARIEAALSELGGGLEPPSGWQDRVLAAAPPRRACRWLAAPACAFAALLLWLALRAAPGARAFTLVLRDEHIGPAMLGDSPHVGDRAHARIAGGAAHRALWVYRDERELVLAWPEAAASAPTSDGAALDAVLTLDRPGRYVFVALSSPHPLPVPGRGSDADLAAAARSGADCRHEELVAR